ncbi:MAG: hypothetical protein RQ735_04145 [Flavobacteriaceae bacterium]|nr:hypothetical protein [Flavobacteriaceae bacterium]
MKQFIAYSFLILASSVYSQTSIRAELNEKINNREYYQLANGNASKIVATYTVDPYFFESPKYTLERWEYNFISKDSINGFAKKDGDLVYNFAFKIDSLQRKIDLKERTKSYLSGWILSHVKYTYKDAFKDLHIYKADGTLNYRVRVAFDSLGNPNYLASLDAKNNFQAIALAEYRYDQKYYNYSIMNATGRVLLEEVQYYNHDYIIQKNKKGDVVKMYEPFEPVFLGIIYLIDYKYDKKGNWTRKKVTTQTPEGTWVSLQIKRKISYID